jgi:hypothetical protein
MERVSLAGRCDYFCGRSQGQASLREFKGATPANPVVDAAKATARLPNLDIESLHRDRQAVAPNRFQ